ncbi:MAG: class I SAM-dependent methyltransferase [Promethearchaeota archaeon]
MMNGDVELWLKELAEPFLEEVGLQSNQQVLDFGCGPGYYVIPAARIVGVEGRIYALDKSAEVLSELRERAAQENLGNIEIIQTSGKLVIPLDDEAVDTVLLYDVIHSHYFSEKDRLTLLSEIHRVLKADGLFSIYPSHMDAEAIMKLIAQTRFQYIESIQKTLLHFGSLQEDQILNYRRI